MAKFYRYTLNGRHTAEAAQAALGAAAALGVVVRVDSSDKETHLILAADAPPHGAHKLPDTIRAVEVPEAQVLHAP
jgi:hypothetical protein